MCPAQPSDAQFTGLAGRLAEVSRLPWLAPETTGRFAVSGCGETAHRTVRLARPPHIPSGCVVGLLRHPEHRWDLKGRPRHVHAPDDQARRPPVASARPQPVRSRGGRNLRSHVQGHLERFDSADHHQPDAFAPGRSPAALPHRPANRRPPQGRGNRAVPNPFGERVPGELYARASAHYDDKALWTLTLAIGQICFFIPVALIAKPIPGKEPHYNK
jgi:hypothetical protein